MSESVELKEQTAKERQKARMKHWRDQNKDRIREYQKEWRERNKNEVAEYQQKYQAEYRGREDVQFKTWMRNLHRNYRMSPADFNEMWAKQDGKCEVCKQQMQPRGRGKLAVAVDHNHETGEVRGLLCRACNHGIGCLRDDPDALMAAAEYLRARGNYSKLARGKK